MNGTVVRWRIRVGDAAQVTNFRIIRPLGGGLFTGAGTSASVTPPINATTSYRVQLPIRIGDYIGLDCCSPLEGESKFFVSDVAAIRNEWLPTLADGGPGRAPLGTSLHEIALNADITTTFTVEAIRRNKTTGTATLTVTVAHAGELTGSGKGVKVASAAVTSKTVQPGAVQLRIKAKGKRKRKLNETGKVKVKPKITYTPIGGEPATKSVKVKLIKR